MIKIASLFKEIRQSTLFLLQVVFKFTLRPQLVNDGCNDWKNLSAKLKQHETSDEHIINMTALIELEVQFQKQNTIDKKL